MRIILLRHAEAEPRGPEIAENERRLTDKGRRQARASAAGIAALGEKVGRLVSSPLTRAVQTATPAGKAWDLAVETDDALGDGFSPQAAMHLLERLHGEGGETVCLVGHMPDLSDLLAHLLGLPAAKAGNLPLNKSGAVCVEIDERPARGAARLRWFLGRKPLASLAT